MFKRGGGWRRLLTFIFVDNIIKQHFYTPPKEFYSLTKNAGLPSKFMVHLYVLLFSLD